MLTVALVLLLGALVSACGFSGGSAGSAASQPVTLRLGYFPNLTHATAVVGVHEGIFARYLPAQVTLQTFTFNAGPSAIEALFAEGLDATYIGPNPAMNGYVRSRGQALRIVAGATSGGAFLVVRPPIASPGDLVGKRVASPQLGNTQDVALRHWLQTQGLRTTVTGTGDVSVVPQENAQTLESFRSGQVDGAWVPEPWATRLVQEAGGRVLLDERELWPGGQFVTTHLVVRAAFLRDRPDLVEALLRGHVEATDFLNRDPAQAQRLFNEGFAKITGSRVPDELLAATWRNLTFTVDPVASSLRKSAADAAELGLLNLAGVSLDGIYDVRLLNQILTTAGRSEVIVQ